MPSSPGCPQFRRNREMSASSLPSAGTARVNFVRKYAAEQGIAEEAALAKGMEQPSVARWTMRSIARQGEAQRSQKSKDSSRWEASEKAFAPRKAEGQGCRSSRCQFVEKGAEVYAKA